MDNRSKLYDNISYALYRGRNDIIAANGADIDTNQAVDYAFTTLTQETAYDSPPSVQPGHILESVNNVSMGAFGYIASESMRLDGELPATQDYRSSRLAIITTSQMLGVYGQLLRIQDDPDVAFNFLHRMLFARKPIENTTPLWCLISQQLNIEEGSERAKVLWNNYNGMLRNVRRGANSFMFLKKFDEDPGAPIEFIPPSPMDVGNRISWRIKGKLKNFNSQCFRAFPVAATWAQEGEQTGLSIVHNRVGFPKTLIKHTYPNIMVENSTLTIVPR